MNSNFIRYTIEEKCLKIIWSKTTIPYSYMVPSQNMLKSFRYEHKTVPNRLNCRFDQKKPAKLFVTDITYLRIGSGQTVYLSCVEDVATHEIMAHHISISLHMALVIHTTNKLAERLRANIHSEVMIHCNQRLYYTRP